MERLRLNIIGQVQGVGFRFAACIRARQLGLTGLVANQPDGSVLIVAEGPRDSLQAFLDWCYTGVRSARVDEVATAWSAARHEFDAFSILA